MQGVTSGDSPHVAVEWLSTSRASVSPSHANVLVNYEPSVNTVSVLYTPPWLSLTDDSPPVPETSTSRPSVMTGSYTAVPVSEPDLSKIPERSALKGGKSRQLEQKRQGRENQQDATSSPRTPKTAITPPQPHPAAVQFSSTGVLPRVPPKVAPKPRIGPWVPRFDFSCIRLLAENRKSCPIFRISCYLIMILFDFDPVIVGGHLF